MTLSTFGMNLHAATTAWEPTMSRKTQKLLNGQFCYACEQPAESWEHAPPRAFFPHPQLGYKGPSGKNYRQGLISVPSCQTHNGDKSQDDNFVQSMIALFAAAYAGRFSEREDNPFLIKLKNRLHSHPRMQKVMREKETVQTPEGPMVALRPEVGVIMDNVELIARALYFHEHSYQKRWPNLCQITSPHFDFGMTPAGPEIVRVLQWFRGLEKAKFMGSELKGPHPEIFAYQLLEAPERTVMRMTFYETFELLAISGIRG